jgi:hypothetical protein
MNLSRRRFLQAGSATLFLPLLESDGRANEEHASFIFFCRQANGVTQGDNNGEPDRFWPNEQGILTPSILEQQPEKVLSELAPWGDYLIAPKGLRYGHSHNGCGHSGGGNQCLTAARVTEDLSGKDSLAMGESVDNYIARHFPQMGGEPLTLYTGPRSGYLEEVLSYRGAQQLRAAEDDPWIAYQRMLGVTDNSYSDLVFTRRQSINDLVLEQINALQRNPNLSTTDRQKLEMHFDSIREFEILAASLSADEEQAMASLSGLGTLNDNRITVARMHMDLIALAFSANYTKAATLQIGDGNDGTQYTVNGTKLPSFHWISHRIYADGSEGETIVGAEDMHHSIDRLFAQTFGHFLSKLEEYGILDQGISVWCNDLGNGVSHSYNNMPFISVGSGNGFLRTGQHIDFEGVTHNQLFNTYINAFGLRNTDGSMITNFGDADLEPGVLEALIQS